MGNNISDWNAVKTSEWFEKAEWLCGWDVKPDSSINQQTFAKTYSGNKGRWEKVIHFMKSNNPASLELKRYDIDGENAFALVSEYITKNPEDALFEAHRKYIDLQYVAVGSELIGLAPLEDRELILQEYNEEKDVEFFTVKNEKTLLATSEKFFIFFPEDAHKPCVKNTSNSLVKKIVVKIKV